MLEEGSYGATQNKIKWQVSLVTGHLRDVWLMLYCYHPHAITLSDSLNLPANIAEYWVACGSIKVKKWLFAYSSCRGHLVQATLTARDLLAPEQICDHLFITTAWSTIGGGTRTAHRTARAPRVFFPS